MPCLSAQRAWLESTYPAFHAAAKREIVNGESLLFTWQGADASLPPILLLAGIRDGEFRFKGLNPEGKVGDWTGEWEDPQLTPLAIQLQLEMSPESRTEWPLLEIVMMVDGGATRGFNAGLQPAGG